MTVTLLLYTRRRPGEPVTAEPARDILDRHRALQAELAREGRLHHVAQLAHDGEHSRVVGTDDVVRDGPYPETKEWLVGFYVVDAPDRQTAELWASRLCVPGDTWVVVRGATWHRSG